MYSGHEGPRITAKCMIKGTTFWRKFGWMMTAAFLLPATTVVSDFDIVFPPRLLPLNDEVESEEDENVCRSCHFSFFGPGRSGGNVRILGASDEVSEKGRMLNCGCWNFHIQMTTRNMNEERSWMRALRLRCSAAGSMIAERSGSKTRKDKTVHCGESESVMNSKRRCYRNNMMCKRVKRHIFFHEHAKTLYLPR
jgi:hypothetical protein